MWSGGAITDLGTLGGSRGYAQGVNSHGQIVGGTQVVGDVDVHATLWSGGRIIDLGTLRGTLGYSAAVAINDSGVIVGGGEWKNYAYHAILWKDGTITDLGTLHGHGESFALGINNAGEVVGYSELPRDGGEAAHPRPPLPVDAAGRESTAAATPEKPRDVRAVLWQRGVIVDLNERLNSDTRAHWVLPSAQAINDAGVITGTARHRQTGARHAFRLAPVSRPVARPAPRTCQKAG